MFRLIALAVSYCVLETAIFPDLLKAKAAAETVYSLGLPYVPGELLMPSAAYQPPVVKGLKLNPKNPLELDFVVDANQDNNLSQAEAMRMIKYFFAIITTPAKDLWVNLSPVESGRVMQESLAATDMGRDMLLQDYLLKQFAASMTYPKDRLGEEFWARVKAKVAEKFGDRDVPMDMVSKVWIVPGHATVYASGTSALILDAELDVMLDKDYQALKSQSDKYARWDVLLQDEDDPSYKIADISASIAREIILPEIKREVNEGRNFAPVRQMFHALILGLWFKKNLKENLINRIYADREVIGGIETDDPAIKQKVYESYLEAFKKGVYNFIQEDYNPSTQEIVSRQYFSGGINFAGAGMLSFAGGGDWLNTITDTQALLPENYATTFRQPYVFSVELAPSEKAGPRQYDFLKLDSAATTASVEGVVLDASDRGTENSTRFPGWKAAFFNHPAVKYYREVIDQAQLSVAGKIKLFFLTMTMFLSFQFASVAQNTRSDLAGSPAITLHLDYKAGINKLPMNGEQQQTFADLKKYVSVEDVTGLNGKVHPGGTAYAIDTNYIKSHWDQIFTSTEYTWAQEAVVIAAHHKAQSQDHQIQHQKISGVFSVQVSQELKQTITIHQDAGSAGGAGGDGIKKDGVVFQTNAAAAIGLLNNDDQNENKDSTTTTILKSADKIYADSVRLISDSTRFKEARRIQINGKTFSRPNPLQIKERLNTINLDGRNGPHPSVKFSVPDLTLYKVLQVGLSADVVRYYNIASLPQLTAAPKMAPVIQDTSRFQRSWLAFNKGWTKWGPRITMSPANFMVFEGFRDAARGDSLYSLWKPNTIAKVKVALLNGGLTLDVGQKMDGGVKYLEENVGRGNQKQAMHQTLNVELKPQSLPFWKKTWLPGWWKETSFLYSHYSSNYADGNGQKTLGLMLYDPLDPTGVTWKNKFELSGGEKKGKATPLTLTTDLGLFHRWMTVNNFNHNVTTWNLGLNADWRSWYVNSQFLLIQDYGDAQPIFARNAVFGFKLPDLYFHADHNLDVKKRRAILSKASVFGGVNWGYQNIFGKKQDVSAIAKDVTRSTSIVDKPGEGLVGVDALILQALRLRATAGFDWKNGLTKGAKLDVRHVVVSLSFTGNGLSEFSKQILVPVLYADNNVMAIGSTVHSWGRQSVGLKVFHQPIWVGVESDYRYQGERKPGKKLELVGGLTHPSMVVSTTSEGLPLFGGLDLHGKVALNQSQGTAWQAALSRRFGNDGHAFATEFSYAHLFTGNDDDGYQPSGILGVRVLGEQRVAPWLTLRGQAGAYRTGNDQWYGQARGDLDLGKTSLYVQASPTHEMFRPTGLWNPSPTTIGMEKELKFGTARVYAGLEKGKVPAYGVGLTWRVQGEKPQETPKVTLPPVDIAEAERLKALSPDLTVADLDSLGIRGLEGLTVADLHPNDRVYVKWEIKKNDKTSAVHQIGYVKAVLISENGPVSVQFVPTHTSDHTFIINGAYVSFDGDSTSSPVAGLKPYGFDGSIVGVESSQEMEYLLSTSKVSPDSARSDAIATEALVLSENESIQDLQSLTAGDLRPDMWVRVQNDTTDAEAIGPISEIETSATSGAVTLMFTPELFADTSKTFGSIRFTASSSDVVLTDLESDVDGFVIAEVLAREETDETATFSLAKTSADTSEQSHIVSAASVTEARNQKERKISALDRWASVQPDNEGHGGPNADLQEATSGEGPVINSIATGNPFDVVEHTLPSPAASIESEKTQIAMAKSNQFKVGTFLLTLLSFVLGFIFVSRQKSTAQKYRDDLMSIRALTEFTTEILTDKPTVSYLFTGIPPLPVHWNSAKRVGDIMAQPFPVVGSIEENDGRMQLYLIFQPDDLIKGWDLNQQQAMRLPRAVKAGLMSVSLNGQPLRFQENQTRAGAHFVTMVFDLPENFAGPVGSVVVSRPRALSDPRGERVEHIIRVGMSEVDQLYYHGELLLDSARDPEESFDSSGYDRKVWKHFQEYYGFINSKHRNIFNDYGRTAEMADKVLRQAGDYLALAATRDVLSEKTVEMLREFTAFARPLYDVASKHLGSIDGQKRMYFERGDTAQHRMRNTIAPVFEHISLTSLWVGFYKGMVLRVLPDIGFHKRRLDVLFGQPPDPEFTFNRLKAGFFTLLNWWQDPNVRSMGGLDAASRINRVLMDVFSFTMIGVGLFYTQNLSGGTLYALSTILAARLFFPLANILTIPVPFSKGFYSLLRMLVGGFDQKRSSRADMIKEDPALFDDQPLDRLLAHYSSMVAPQAFHSVHVRPKRVGFEVSFRSTGRIWWLLNSMARRKKILSILKSDLEQGVLVFEGFDVQSVSIEVHPFGVNFLLPYKKIKPKSTSITIRLKNDSGIPVLVERDAMTGLMDTLNALDEQLVTERKLPSSFRDVSAAIRMFYRSEINDNQHRHHFRNNLAAYRKLRGKVDHVRVRLAQMAGDDQKAIKTLEAMNQLSIHVYEVIRFYGEMASADVEKRLGFFKGPIFRFLRNATFVHFFVERAVSQAYVAAENSAKVQANTGFARHLIAQNKAFDKKLMRPSPYVMLGEQWWRTLRRYIVMAFDLLVAVGSVYGLMDGLMASVFNGEIHWYGLNLQSLGGFYIVRKYFAIPLSGIYWVVKEYRQSMRGFLHNRVIVGRSGSWIVSLEGWLELVLYSAAIVVPWLFPFLALGQYGLFKTFDSHVQKALAETSAVDIGEDVKAEDNAQLNARSSMKISGGEPTRNGGIDFDLNLDQIRIIDGDDRLNPVPFGLPVINLQDFRRFNFKLIKFDRVDHKEILAQLGIKSEKTQLSYAAQPGLAGL